MRRMYFASIPAGNYPLHLVNQIPAERPMTMRHTNRYPIDI